MRFVEGWAFAILLFLLPGGPPVHQQRYCMGTMFDIVAYHPAPPRAERAVNEALDEIERLDGVMSHFKPESDLSRLNRNGRHGFVKVDPALYDVVDASLAFSRASGGKFDVTIAPLVRIWKEAQEKGRTPSPAAVAAARECVGYEKVDLQPPDQIRFRSDCLEIELGGIGKGYAVDRAIGVLKSAGIRDAVVNGGTSSITGIGTPPGGNGWPVRLGPSPSARELLLRNRSISTSQQDGAIIDPEKAAPVLSWTRVTVSAPTATLADALSTALVIMTKAEGANLMGHFADVSAIYIEDAR